MKKVLFATTALVASAGFAAADVDVSGSAEMGVAGGTSMETQFWQSVDVRFTMTGETDNGLSFGATVDAQDFVDMGQAGQDGTDIGGANALADFTVFVSGNFGTITMGDTDGAFDWALSEVALAGGSLNDAETAHAGYNGNGGLDGTHGGQVVRYDHSVGDFSFAVSAEIDDTAPVADEALGIGARYSGDLGGVTLGVGLGYQTNATSDIYGVSLNASMDNGVSVGLNYSDLDGAIVGGIPRDSHIGLGVAYSMDALTIAANYGEYDNTAGTKSDGFGLVANYDLGGGAVVQFGYGSGSTGPAPSSDSWSLGVAMAF